MRTDSSLAQDEIAPEAPARPGRPELIERLFREHNEALIRFLLPRVRSRQAALEVAQEAYVRLLSLDQPGAVSYLRSFLFKTAANLAIDWARRADVHTRALDTPLYREFTDDRTPERAAAGAQEVKRLGELLMTLPPKCREAFVLNRFHGMDLPAVAAKMKLSERMVRTYGDATSPVAWQHGRLAFESEPLRYVIQDVNRYATKPIELADDQTGDIRVTGTVTEANIIGWINSLQAAFRIRAEIDADRIVLRPD